MSAVHRFFTQRRTTGGTEGEAVAQAFGAPQASSSTVQGEHVVKRTSYHIAVEGCCHGELDKIYDACARHEAQTGKKVDLLICCGDFQAVREGRDLANMAVPDKYKTLGDFHHYYRDPASHGGGGGGRLAPYLTIFIGGNHENADWLAEESYGGYLAPNIYYLGHSGVVIVDGVLRIAGLSGIYKAVDYFQPYPIRPYALSEQAKRSAYHVRCIEVEKLRAYFALLRRQCGEDSTNKMQQRHDAVVDIMLSHDWPVGITKYGNEEQLLRYKPYFREDIAHKALGNPHTMALMQLAQPRYWYSAHLHCRFQATVPFSSTASNDAATAHSTSFLALDKCGRSESSFLEFVDIPLNAAVALPCRAVSNERVERDTAWLRVLIASHRFVSDNVCLTSRCSSSSRDGFDAESFVKSVVDKGEQGGSNMATAIHAPTTAALLTAIQLQPAPRLHTTQTEGVHLGRHAAPSTAKQTELTTATAEQPSCEPLGWAEDLAGP